MSGFGQALGFGIVSAALIALSAVAMSMQFGVTKHPNFAHGEFLTVSAFTMVEMQKISQNLFLDAAAGICVSAALAWAINKTILRPFRRVVKRLVIMLIITAAVSQIIEAILAVVFGTNYVVLGVPNQTGRHIGPFVWTPIDMVIIALAIAVVGGLHFLLRYTSFGKAQRAVADDIDLARVVGINAASVISRTWLLTGAVAGLAGAALAVTIGTFSNLLGFSFLLVTFAAVIVGGVGKMYGAVVGSLIVGIITELSGYYLSSGYKQVIALCVLIAVLLVRPNGLFTTFVADTKA
jgi:branched-subunit amino acid ABC-type transport system permease component